MTTRTADYDEIVRVVKLYIDGFNDNDISKFKEAFHEDAWIFYIDADGALHKNLICAERRMQMYDHKIYITDRWIFGLENMEGIGRRRKAVQLLIKEDMCHLKYLSDGM